MVTERPCNGDAHKPEVGGMMDHCAVCMPRWGVVESLAPNGAVFQPSPQDSRVGFNLNVSGITLGSRVQHAEHGKGRVVAVVVAGRCEYLAPNDEVVRCATQQPSGFTIAFDSHGALSGWSAHFASPLFFTIL